MSTAEEQTHMVLDGPNPLLYDVLLNDVRASDLRENVAKQLKVDYLSVFEGENGSNELHGVIFGAHSRPMLSAVVHRSSSNKRNVTFLLDTGSPQTYITAEVIEAIGIQQQSLTGSPFKIKINNRVVLAAQSCNHFADVNLLGADFLSANECDVRLDYQNKKFTVVIREE
jgi:DNA-binding protein Fis